MRTWLYTAAAFLAGIGILLLLMFGAGFQRIISILLLTSPSLLLLAMLIYTIQWVFRTWRLACFTSHRGWSIRMSYLFKVQISGFALNSLLPARLGEVATIGLLTTRGIGMGEALALVLQSRILDLLTLVLFIVPSFVFYSGMTSHSWITASILCAFTIIAIPFGAVILDRKEKFLAWLDKLDKKQGNPLPKKIIIVVKEAYRAYRDLLLHKRLFAATLLLSIMLWLIDGLVCFCVALAVGVKMPLIVFIIAMALANLGKGAPIVPGGIGIYESVMSAALVFFGVPFSDAVVIALLDHLIKKSFNLSIGIAVIPGLGINVSEILKRSKSVIAQ